MHETEVKTLDVHRVAVQVVELQPARESWLDVGMEVERAGAGANPESRGPAAQQVFVFVAPDEQVGQNKPDLCGNSSGNEDPVKQRSEVRVDPFRCCQLQVAMMCAEAAQHPVTAARSDLSRGPGQPRRLFRQAHRGSYDAELPSARTQPLEAVRVGIPVI